jgi:hypothetical protein
MPQTPDLSDIFGKPSGSSILSSSSPDLSDIFGGKSSPSLVTPPLSTSSQSTTDLSDIFGGGSRPAQATTAPTHVYQDPNAAWYSRAFDWANTPLTTSLFGLPEEREGASGLERGVEHIAAGLTSPLSVALGLATFGTGGFLTSAGETALKEATLAGGEAAFSAADIAQVAKGSQAALKAYHSVPEIEPLIQGTLGVGGHDLGLLQKAREFFGPVSHDMELAEPKFQKILSHAGLNPQQIKALGEGAISAEEREAIAVANGGFTTPELKELARTGKAIKNVTENAGPVRQAVEAAGVDWDTYTRGRDFLHASKMDEAALLGGDLIDRGAFQILHHVAPDLSLGTTLKAARTAKTLMNTGFTLQQLEGAAAMSPRFFDALKEGDYDKAAEYGTEWAANAVLGVAGASHALHSWGELAEPILGAKLKPSDEQLRVNNLNGVREAEHAVGDQQGIDVHRETIRSLGYDPDKIFGMSKAEKEKLADDLVGLHLAIESGKDAGFADAYRTQLRRALGLGDEARPVNGLPEGKPITPEEVPPRANTKVVFQNDHGEVRVGSDGRPVVWMSPEAWSEFEAHIGKEFSGINYSKAQVDDLVSQIRSDHPLAPPIAELFKAAQGKGHVTAVRPDSGVLVVGEELHHSWQRGLVENGDILGHLDGATLQNGVVTVAPGSQWARLNDTIPKGQHGYMDALDYPKDPVTRVTETAAKFRAGRIPEGVTPEEAVKWIQEYNKEIKAKHGVNGEDSVSEINAIARQHMEDRNVRSQRQVLRPTDLPDGQTGSGVLPGLGEGTRRADGVVPEEQGGVRGKPPEGLTAHEVEKEPVSFVSPNVYKIGNVSEAAHRLNSRPQKLAEKLSEDIGAHLGIKASVRPAIGHWEGGAENSMVSRFAPGTSPDAVEYHNAIMAKVERQNTGISFHPDPKGPDVAFQFRVPSAVADPKTIARLLEEHHISGSSIEPVPGGHNVLITSPGGELRGPVSEIASRLKATEVKEHNGRQVTLGDWNDRNAASTVYDARIRELEAAHPEWHKVRTELESSPAYNTLSKLIREAEDKVKSDETASPFLAGVHGSRTANITELDPGFQGKGPQGGAEMARAKNFPGDFVQRSYLNLEGSKREPFYERLPYQYRAVLNSENFYNWVADQDGLLQKAEKEAAVRKMDTQPGAVGTIYERMMKDAGYDGYYHPGHNQIGVFKNTPVERSMAAGAGSMGLFSRENPTWNDVKKHLTSEEIEKHDTPEKRESLLAAFKSMPSHDEWVAATKAGKAGQMWYERSSRAFDALVDSGLDVFKPIDKDRFLNFVAALSPVQTVRSNLLMAVDLWSKWDKAGRPTDVEWGAGGVSNKSAKLYKLMKRGVDLPARLNNAVRALQGEELSGPKVSAFTQNLGDDTSRVTNDTWMAVFGDQDPNRIGKPAIYDAMSAHVRAAAKAEKIEPRQAQAAVWSFVKTLAELSGWGHDRWIPPQEIIKQGLLTQDLVGKYSADFADLLSHDEEIRAKLQKVGGNLDRLDANLKSYAPAKPATEGAVEGATQHLLTAADRLEAARNNTRTQAHLARKQEGGLLDQNTDFNPQTVGTAAGAKADTDFFAQAKAELKTDDISAIARRAQELKESARPVNGQTQSARAGLFSKEQPEKENLAPQWYLKSNQLVDSRMQGPMPADTVLKMMENNGVKPDELKYTGLSDFLKEKGSEPVRPEELREYLKANNLQIKEVTKGAEGTPKVTYEIDNSGRYPEMRVFADGRLVAPDVDDFDSTTSREDLQHLAEDVARDRLRSSSTSAPRYGSYVLPGGDNYRELLMTLPEDNPKVQRLKNQITEITELPSAQTTWNGEDRTAAYDRLYKEMVDAGGSFAAQNRNAFRSSHWPDEINPVGHVRFNDRTGPNGEKLLHLEELQSDWHQKGRKGRYVDPQKPFGIPTSQEKFATRAEAEAAADAAKIPHTLINDERTSQRPEGAVPDAPFKKTWPEFLFKRMVRYAAENGYDGISWTPGEEQAARYDLSKQVKDLEYDPHPHEQRLRAYDHSGTELINEADVPPSKLADYVGKEAAQKLLQSEKESDGWQRLSGVDLKVGGEGMKGFYDKIVPDLANKLGKQFGAKVGETKIGRGDVELEERLQKEIAAVRDEHSAAVQDLHNIPDSEGYENSPRYRAALNKAYDLEEKWDQLKQQYAPVQDSFSKKVPYFPVTDSLRESVLKQGQPLFAREGRPVNGLPEGIEGMLQDNEFAKRSPEYQQKIIRWLDMIAENKLPDHINKAYKYATAEDGKNWELAHRNGMMEEFTDNHVHRKYLKNEEGNVVVSDAKAGKFATNTTGARRRTYDTLMTALLKSPDEIKFDPAEAISKDRAEVVKAAANRKFISQLMSSGLRASDGRPVAYLNGAGNVVSGENGKDPKIFADPERVRKINIDDKTIQHLTQSGDLQRFLDDGTIRDITPYVHPDNIGGAIDRLSKEALKSIDYTKYGEQGNNVLLSQIERLKEMQKTGDYSGLKELNDMQSKSYAWSPQGYVALDHSAMRGWNFVTNAPDGSSVLVNSDIMAHPEYAQYLKNRLGLEKGALSQSSVGRAVLSAGKAAKETLLSLSPFHLVQIGIRAIQTGINPFTLHGPDIESGARVNPLDPHSPTKIKKMVEQGMMTGTDYKGQQAFTEGVSSGGNHSLLRRVPVVGPILADTMSWQTDLLFKRYLPAVKMTAAEKLFDDYRAKYPEWSVDKVARAAAQHSAESFGGINWRAMGRNATTSEMARAVLLAPDWLEAELRSGARLFNKDEGAIGRRQVIMMAGSVYLLARVLNAVTTGNPHYEAPFDLATKSPDGKETLWSIRTLPGDLLHAAAAPASFIKGRLSPGIGLTTEMITGRDRLGRKMQPADLWVDALHNLLPIPVQSLGQAMTDTGPAVGNAGQVWKASGGTARMYQTPAAEKAVALASNHSEDGFVAPDQQARHRMVQQLGDKVRSGEMPWADLVKLTYSTNQLTEAELRKIQNNIKATHGMPTDIARLYTRASHLPAKEFLEVWDTANLTEQRALQPLLFQNQKKYLRKSAKDLTPEQRQQDPVFQRFLNMIAKETPTQ